MTQNSSEHLDKRFVELQQICQDVYDVDGLQAVFELQSSITEWCNTIETCDTKVQVERKNLHSSIFKDGELSNYIAKNTVDPWSDTPFRGYAYMSPKQKGEFGEMFVSKLAEQGGNKVEKAHSSTAGYDRVINDMKVEIKFSLACRAKTEDFGVHKDQFVLNHISKGKDWERLIFCGVNPKEEDLRILWFNKADFVKHIESECVSCFNTQQGGKKIQNDDYMCTNIHTLQSYDWVHEGIKTAFTL